ncbi:hypothetical protein ASG73_09200 [Janibacter sp. Soil728]|uniref:helix-turn-helix transcriptional regulator n=1 Tax=Janibacter sp. Soil728 TaxID=1736393 RepID=UPI0006F381BE|nr:helix-turn-helix domain-containing protein [Janibacter sp. Soil728]KRE37801.1 hypothetical protein ASG73_09200 [Janibacter sp. Soil728]
MESTPGSPGVQTSEGTEPAGTGAGLLRSAVRRDIIDTLSNLPAGQRHEGLTAQELSRLVGLHVTTVRFHLDRLVAAGLVDGHSVRSPGAGRPSKRYVAAAGSFEAARSDSYATLASLLAEAWSARTADGTPLAPEQAGAAWAHARADDLVARISSTEPAATARAWLSKVDLVIDVLRAWGYTPAVRTHDDGRTVDVDVVACPFGELARDLPEVVCGVHRGLMRGALEVLGERDAELSLTPFVTPTLCTAHVTTRTRFAPRGGIS